MTSGLVGVDIKNGKFYGSKLTLSRFLLQLRQSLMETLFIVVPATAQGAGFTRSPRAVTKFSSKRVWFSKDVVSCWSTPVLHDGHLYGMFSFKKYGNGPIQCIELATGKEK